MMSWMFSTAREYSQETHDEEAGKILRHAHERRNNAPGYRQRGKPELGRRPFENNVTRDLFGVSFCSCGDGAQLTSNRT